MKIDKDGRKTLGKVDLLRLVIGELFDDNLGEIPPNSKHVETMPEGFKIYTNGNHVWAYDPLTERSVYKTILT